MKERELREWTFPSRAVLLFMACLIAGCLQPTSISDSERMGVSNTEPVAVSDTERVDAAYLIDTGSYQVGNSWEYEAITHYAKDGIKDETRPTEESDLRFVLVSKRIADTGRIEFDMEITKTTRYNFSGEIRGTLKNKSYVKYFQTVFGLLEETIKPLGFYGLAEAVQPGQFPLVELLNGPEVECGIGADTLPCKSLVYEFNVWSIPQGPCCCNSCMGHLAWNQINRGMYRPGLGFIMSRNSKYFGGDERHTQSKLVARNDLRIPEINVPELEWMRADGS